MEEDGLASAVRKELLKLIQEYDQAILGGGMTTWDAYQKNTGIRQGLMASVATMDSVAKKRAADNE